MGDHSNSIAVAAGLAFGWATALSQPLIIGHRGAAADAPENTLAAMREGLTQGADAVECDLRLTADGHAILLHDPSTRRTTGRDLVAALSPLAELRRLDAGAWKGSRWRGERVPTLEELLALVPAERGLVLEIKCGPEIIPALERAFREAGLDERRVLFLAFERETLAAVKRAFPGTKGWWLVSWAKDPATQDWPRVADLAERARAEGFDGLGLSQRFPLDAAAVAEVHTRGMKLGVWTVNEAALARRLAAAGVDAITTDRPAWLRARLAER